MWNAKQTIRERRAVLQAWLVTDTARTIIGGLVVVLLVLNVVKTSAVSTEGFELSELQKRIEQLEHETTRLGVQVADQRSIRSLEKRIDSLDMVQAGEVVYAKPVGTAVARR